MHLLRKVVKIRICIRKYAVFSAERNGGKRERVVLFYPLTVQFRKYVSQINFYTDFVFNVPYCLGGGLMTGSKFSIFPNS